MSDAVDGGLAIASKDVDDEDYDAIDESVGLDDYDLAEGEPDQDDSSTRPVLFSKNSLSKTKSAPTFADLAELSRQRDELMKSIARDDLTDMLTGVSPVKSGPKRAISADQKRANASKRMFLEFIRKRRGTCLRAWRLDIDKKATNRVAYLDLKVACRQMGMPFEEFRKVWLAFRPKASLPSDRNKSQATPSAIGGCAATPLEFHEIDPQEWNNLNSLLEILWDEFNFDLDLIWSFMDEKNVGNVDLEQFDDGLGRMGFRGESRHIFHGMDLAGKGKIYKEDLFYFKYLQPESHGHPEDSPLVRELAAWVKKTFESSEAFMDRLGMRLGSSSMTISSLARKLERLGFPGNCLHTAMTLSRCNHHIDRHDLLDVIGHTDVFGNSIGCRVSKSYVGRHYNFKRAPRAKITHDTTQEKPPWDDQVYDFAPLNRVMGKREKHCFSFPFPRPIRDQMIQQRQLLKEAF